MTNEIISIVKKNGTVISDIAVRWLPSGDIMIFGDKLPIEEGDIVVRTLPNGLEDKSAVIDRGFNSHPRPHYQVKTRKFSNIEQPAQNITVNLHGQQSRVNIHSVDSSTNISTVDVSTKFSEIQNAIKDQIPNVELQEIYLSKLGELESAIGSRKDITKYQEFISTVADHITIFTPFIPFLTSLLGKYLGTLP